MKKKKLDKQLAVLAYHKIGGPPADGWDTWHYIPEAIFVEQMKLVHNSDWSVIDLTTVLAGLDKPEIMPDRGLLLTFDDGYQMIRTVAFPILQQFGFPAVCFVPTDHIGRLNTFDEGIEPIEPMCNLEDLRKLDRNGMEIQSHGVTHYWLSLLDHESLKREFVQSKQVLEEGLGKPIEVFAFPYGDSGRCADAVDSALRQAGYRAAFLFGESNTNKLPLRNPFRIDRLAVYRDTDLQVALA